MQLAAVATGSILFPLKPFPDESLAGFVLRTASWNQIDSALLLRSIGKGSHGSFSSQVAPKISDAARRLGLSSTELELRVYAAKAGAAPMVSYFGTSIEGFRLNLSTRRLSPASLRASPYHRAIWEIAAINYCPESWEFLIEQCPRCHRKLGWRPAPAIDLCGACGADLKQVGVTKVDPADRDMLDLVAKLVNPVEARRRDAKAAVSNAFRSFSDTALFELAQIFARALRRHSPDPWLRSNLRPSARLARAMELVYDFPRSFEQAIAASQHDNSRQSELLLQWAKDLASSRYPELRELAQTAAILRGQRRLKAVREAKGMLTLREVASRLQIQKSEVGRLARRGFFGPGMERGDVRMLKWFHPNTVEMVRSTLRDRISAREVERSFGLTRAAIEQLVSLGILRVSFDPVVCELYGGLQFRRSAFDHFVTGVQETLWQPRPGVPSITLDDLFQGVGGREKPWGAFIRAFLADRLPGGLALPPGSRFIFANLLVGREFADAFLAGEHPHLMNIPPPAPDLLVRDFVSRKEAERYLNCFPRDISWLIENRYLASIDDKPLRITRSDVEQLGALLISSREMLRRWRISPTFRDLLAVNFGIKRIIGPFWARSEVTDLFKHLLPQGKPT